MATSKNDVVNAAVEYVSEHRETIERELSRGGIDPFPSEKHLFVTTLQYIKEKEEQESK